MEMQKSKPIQIADSSAVSPSNAWNEAPADQHLLGGTVNQTTNSLKARKFISQPDISIQTATPGTSPVLEALPMQCPNFLQVPVEEEGKQKDESCPPITLVLPKGKKKRASTT